MLLLSSTKLFTEKQLSLLSRQGIKSIKDFLFNSPRRYIDRSNPLDISKSKVGDLVTFIGKVTNSEVQYGRRRRLTATVDYNGLRVELTFFQGIPYFQKMVLPGTEAAFSGKLDSFRGRLTITHPEIEIVSEKELVHSGQIVPLYKITDGMRKAFLTTRTIREKMNSILADYADNIDDHLSQQYLNEKNLMSLQEAVKKLHFPDVIEDVYQAKARLALDELIFFSIIMFEEKKKRLSIAKGVQMQLSASNESGWPEKIIKDLPFKLTGDQSKAISQLQSMVYQTNPFACLLQGDVGSGKTIVALITALEYMQHDVQVVLMAPTEILARQHYMTFKNFLVDFPFLQIELLLGAEKVAERKRKLDAMSRGESLLVVGTHSLIQKDIEFRKLGLVIIDEQHRFGVDQRSKLLKKGLNCDVLAMTATPIPRTLTLTMYGDYETIFIREKPKGRKPIDTRLFYDKDLPKLYAGVKKYVDQGRQAYIVYPLIEENESQAWSSIMADYDELEKLYFKGYRLGLLHGKLSNDEKERAMQKFKEGTIQILIATTVVEVGVDIPNANVMLIRNANRFGLSQLHQLRGRVGRSEHQSFCILVQTGKLTDEADQRLQAMVESEDGFYLSQKDFEIRGPGEVLGGKSQAGFAEFRFADLRYHGDLAELAQKLIQSAPSLREKITTSKRWKTEFKKGLMFFNS